MDDKKVAAYCRVSREDLNNENQEKVIRDFCARQGWTNIEFFKEEMSSRKTRPIKTELLQKLREAKYDIVVFARLDRWARSLIELVQDIDYLVEHGVRVISIQNGFDFAKDGGGYNSTNRFALQVMAAFAEMEREIIRERTLEGLARAKAWGKRLGRPPKKKSVEKSGGDLQGEGTTPPNTDVLPASENLEKVALPSAEGAPSAPPA